MQGVADGYFHQESVDKHANELNERTASGKAHAELHNAWQAYHGSFVNTEEDVIKPLHACFMRNAHFFSLNELNSLYNLANTLGFPDLASEMLNKYIEVNKDTIGAFSLEDLFITRDDYLADDVRNALQAAARRQLPEYEVDEMFMQLTKEGYNAEINKQLAELPVEEYIRVFKAHEGKDFGNIINGVRQWLNLTNPTESITTIMDKSALAFIEIGKESSINAYRVKRWGLIERYEARQAAQAEKTAPSATDH